MRLFGYMQGIPGVPTVFSPFNVLHKDVDKIFEVSYDHVVPTDVPYVSPPQPWSAVYGYIQWFYRFSHNYMTLDAEGDPPWLSYQETLEEDNAKVYHVIDVLLICQ